MGRNAFDCIKLGILLNKYTKHMMTEKGKATLFVKKHLKKAKKGVWIEIVETDVPKCYEIGYLQFKTVVCNLYQQTIEPEYPPKAQFSDKDEYKRFCEAIDWETAQKDIRSQKRRGERGTRYIIEGAIILNTKNRPPMFIKSAPDRVKALANDIKDKSNPAWEEAYKYLNPEYLEYDEYKYKIKKIQEL